MEARFHIHPLVCYSPSKDGHACRGVGYTAAGKIPDNATEIVRYIDGLGLEGKMLTLWDQQADSAAAETKTPYTSIETAPRRWIISWWDSGRTLGGVTHENLVIFRP